MVNSFVALNDKLDLQYNETTSLSEPLPSSAMKSLFLILLRLHLRAVVVGFG